MKLHVQKIHPQARIPSFAHETDAGLDLYCVEEITIKSHERVQVKIGIGVGIPEGHVGLIWDKSGVSHKLGLKTLGGVIDSGYTGEVVVGMYNTSNESHTFAVGDKVAQILIQKVEHPEIVEVESLGTSTRGAKGFGSTGK